MKKYSGIQVFLDSIKTLNANCDLLAYDGYTEKDGFDWGYDYDVFKEPEDDNLSNDIVDETTSDIADTLEAQGALKKLLDHYHDLYSDLNEESEKMFLYQNEPRLPNNISNEDILALSILTAEITKIYDIYQSQKDIYLLDTEVVKKLKDLISDIKKILNTEKRPFERRGEGVNNIVGADVNSKLVLATLENMDKYLDDFDGSDESKNIIKKEYDSMIQNMLGVIHNNFQPEIYLPAETVIRKTRYEGEKRISELYKYFEQNCKNYHYDNVNVHREKVLKNMRPDEKVTLLLATKNYNEASRYVETGKRTIFGYIGYKLTPPRLRSERPKAITANLLDALKDEKERLETNCKTKSEYKHLKKLVSFYNENRGNRAEMTVDKKKPKNAVEKFFGRIFSFRRNNESNDTQANQRIEQIVADFDQMAAKIKEQPIKSSSSKSLDPRFFSSRSSEKQSIQFSDCSLDDCDLIAENEQTGEKVGYILTSSGKWAEHRKEEVSPRGTSLRLGGEEYS